MTVKSGREFLAIPGPTTVPDEVLSAMHRPAIDVYGDELIDMTATCFAGLKRVVPHRRGGVRVPRPTATEGGRRR